MSALHGMHENFALPNLLHFMVGVFDVFAGAVAHVTYKRASCAAAAQDQLHETVLSDGGTKLRVMLADAPHSRCSMPCQ